MTFPLWYLLIPYAVVVAIVGLFVFFNLFHLGRYGLSTFGTTLLMALYILSFTGVLGASLLMFSVVDWSRPFALSEIVPFFEIDRSQFGL